MNYFLIIGGVGVVLSYVIGSIATLWFNVSRRVYITLLSIEILSSLLAIVGIGVLKAHSCIQIVAGIGMFLLPLLAVWWAIKK